MPLPSIPYLPHLSAWLQRVAAEVHAHYEFHPLHPFALVGILFTLYLVERAIDFVFFHFATPWKPLQAYRRRGPKPTYALVTGASAGIGLGVAKALVKQGFGVIILGHKADELASAAAELRAALVLPQKEEEEEEEGEGGREGDNPVHQGGLGVEEEREEYVKTIVMDARTATPEEMEAQLRATIVDAELRVSILVNNVGSLPIALPAFRALATYSPTDIDDTIALNARFPTRLTTLLLPVLTHRGAGVDARGMSFGTHRRSLILNVSSGGMVGLPYLVLYSATKGFNHCFSRALARECEVDPATRHIDVLGVVPGDVQSQGNSVPASRWTTPTSDAFGWAIVHKADGAVGRGWREMYPHWLHHLQAMMMGIISEKSLTKFIRDVAVFKKDNINGLHPGKPKDD